MARTWFAEGTARAISEYRKGMNVYALAKRCGISPSSLYRVLKDKGFKFGKGTSK